jgi:uncharacterized lipoprotein YddW (UPF0748 family)
MARFPTATLLVLGLLAALACGDSEPPKVVDVPPPAAPPAPRLRGLWVLCEGSQRVLEHPERIAVLIADAQRMGVSDLFVQVYRGGRAWFDSSHADAAPYRALREATGEDTLAQLITQAHENDLRVHAWVNVLSLANNRDAPILADVGPSAVLVDRWGRSVLDYPKLDVPPPDRRYYRMGTPAVWLDPAAPGVAERLVETFRELLTKYPELDGLHLDYIRYPDVLPFTPGSRFGVGLDFGYGDATRARFQAETGLEAPFGGSLANANAWDGWRRDQVTALVAALRIAARSALDDIEFSAAVWSWADRAYLAQGQDWRRWLEEGLLEFAVPMSYTLDDRMLRYQVESYSGHPAADRIWVGLGTWLFARRPERALEQIRIVRAAGAAGDSLFSWDSIADAPALLDALAAEASVDATETPGDG